MTDYREKARALFPLVPGSDILGNIAAALAEVAEEAVKSVMSEAQAGWRERAEAAEAKLSTPVAEESVRDALAMADGLTASDGRLPALCVLASAYRAALVRLVEAEKTITERTYWTKELWDTVQLQRAEEAEARLKLCDDGTPDARGKVKP